MTDDLWTTPHIPRQRLAARPGDPETSQTAACETGMVRRAQRERLFAAFQEAGPAGLTDEEAALRVGLFSTHSCWWKRASELRGDGRIEFTKRTRPGVMGRQRKVSVVAES